MLEIDIKKQLHGASGAMELEVNLHIKQGEFVAISGESGSGKTTLLRVLAGLEESYGSIKLQGDVWQEGKFSLPIQQRKIGFVFQDYALFENMTVEQNLLFVEKNRELAEHLLSLTGLSQLKKRYPNTLSGGQKQRVALCRAFMNQPKLLLMDEPLSALDKQMRIKLQSEIVTLHKEFGTTTIMVSHDPSEIYRMSSRVVVLNLGKIVKDDRAEKIFKSKTSTLKGEVIKIESNKIVLLVAEQLVELPTADYASVKLGQVVEINLS